MNFITIQRSKDDSNNLEYENVSTSSTYYFDTTNLSNEEIAQRYNCTVGIDKRFGMVNRYFVPLVKQGDKNVKYNSSFWNSKPCFSDWETMKKDLEKLSTYKLEEQFLNNSSFLMSESLFLRVARSVKGKERKKYMIWYRDNKKQDLFK